MKGVLKTTRKAGLNPLLFWYGSGCRDIPVIRGALHWAELETLNIDACTKLYLFLKPNHSKAKNNDMSLKIFYYKTVDILSLK
jgi:hypothetical protein